MTSRILLIAISIFMMIPLGGCWDRKELNELGIAVAIGVDTAPRNQLKVTAQVVVPSKVAPGQLSGKVGTSVTVYEQIAPTFTEAIQKMTVVSPRKVYLGHIRMLVIGEKFARKGIASVVETLIREPSSRADYYIVVAKEQSASDILKITTSLEKIPANKMFTSLNISSDTWAPYTKVTIDDLMNTLLDASGCPVLTGIHAYGTNQDKSGEGVENITKTEPTVELKFVGLGVFKKDRLVDWLNESESKGYNFIRNQVKETREHYDTGNGVRIGFHTFRNKTEVKAAVVQGNPLIRINVTSEGALSEIQGDAQVLNSSETLHQLERQSSKRVVELMKQAVDSARQRHHADIFGFGELIHEENPKAWKKLKKDWERMLTELNVHYTVDTKISKVGTLLDTFQKKMKE